MKIYIAGKVTGEPHEVVVKKFKKKQLELEKQGFEVVNPVDLVNNPNEPWKKAMITCLTALMKCEAICLLPCFEDSKGALLEHMVAKSLGIIELNQAI
jgi:hypothetical protein